jgi:hypothetical protein
MKNTVAPSLLWFAITLHSSALAQPSPDPDPLGVVLKPIPKKLVGLTFDDGSLPDAIKIEELCLANQIARPTTFCWPIYSTSRAFSMLLVERGYLFARSGGRNDRPYRPTLENPFETPSFTMVANTPQETFTSAAQRATRGRIPIFTFHGVPDIEHPGISVDPALIEKMEPAW